METYGNHNIQEIPLSSPFFHAKVESFLRANGLRMETLDVYYTLQNDNGDILAGAGLSGDVIKCVAVTAEARSEGLLAPVLSHLISQHGGTPLKVFTKPGNEYVFESMGFHTVGRAPLAILMENGHGLEQYCQYLKGFRTAGRCGVVVMNANPFTLGHRYLLEQASKQVDTLFVIPVREDRSAFPYAERLAMIQAAAGQVSEDNYFLSSCPKNQFSSDNTAPESQLWQKICFSQSLAKNNYLPSKIVVLEGSEYQISAATFPTYFLKDLSEAAETQMRLDLDIFVRHIAPALNASVRFVGSEPKDPLTARYNAIMKEVLPEVVEIQRLIISDENYFSQGFAKNQFSSVDRTLDSAEENYFSQGFAKNQFSSAISASCVREALETGSFREAAALCPETSHPYLLAFLADRALRLELDMPSKPGLVGPDGPGAHKDMDYDTMQRGIAALRPFWSRMAMATSVKDLQQLGIKAEQAMLAATGGVNTHRGAIFALGLALYARFPENADNQPDMKILLCKIAQEISRKSLIDCNLQKTHGQDVVTLYGVKGARAMAEEGYETLWAVWLPYYRALGQMEKASPFRLQKTLLRIMSTLDDTCVIHRVGFQRAQEVKKEAGELLEHFSEEGLVRLCDRYAIQGISPGGAADMLALTILMDSLTN